MQNSLGSGFAGFGVQHAFSLAEFRDCRGLGIESSGLPSDLEATTCYKRASAEEQSCIYAHLHELPSQRTNAEISTFVGLAISGHLTVLQPLAEASVRSRDPKVHPEATHHVHLVLR